MPDWKPALRHRLASLRLDPTREAAIVEELAQHLDCRYDELQAGGASPDEAAAGVAPELERAVLLAANLSPLSLAREPRLPAASAPRRGAAGAWQDLRHAARSLVRHPAFTLIACGTLAVGIGVTTAMFGFINGLLLRPLPYQDPDALSRLYRVTSGSAYEAFTIPEFTRLRRESGGVAAVAAYAPAPSALEDAGAATEWLSVSPDLFRVLGLRPTLGRDFQEGEGGAGGERVVVISHTLWETQFARDPAVVGRTIRTGGEDFTIVGVLPPSASDHRLFGRVGLFSPVDWTAPQGEADASTQTVAVLARREAGVSGPALDAWLSTFARDRQLSRAPADTARGWRSEPLPRTDTSPTGQALLGLLLALSSSVLVIGCANLAHLVLARTLERSREIAVRAALGASRLQLARTVVFEAVLLAAAGVAGGLVLAGWMTGWLRAVIIAGGGPPLNLPVDWRVAAFACGLAGLTAMFFSLLPILLSRRLNTVEELKAGGRGTTASRSQRRVRHLLVAGQIALALMLLASAGTFLRGAAAALETDHGWQVADVVQADVSLPEGRSNEEIVQTLAALVDGGRMVPGSAGASISYGLPYLGLRGHWRLAGDAQAWGERGGGFGAELNGILGDYFAVTGTPVIAGRHFDERDTAASPNVVIVSASLARALFGGAPAIGRRIADAGRETPDWAEIVGIAADVRSVDIARDVNRFQVYRPATQDVHRQAVLAVRTQRVPAGATVAAMRRLVNAVGADIVVRNLMPVQALMDREVISQMRLVLRLLTIFAAVGVLLAALGTYAVMARMVGQRTAEIGLRMALGAPARGITRLVLGSALRVAASGAVLGLAGAAALSRLFAAVFPGLDGHAPAALGGALAALLVVALLAAWAPARRAARIDPLTALRSE